MPCYVAQEKTQAFEEPKALKMTTQTFLQQLVAVEDGEAFNAAWDAFFLDPVRVVELSPLVTKEIAAAVLQAGVNWNGSGWTTSRASKQLFSLVNVALVSGDIGQYRNSFLFALALLWEVEVPTLELGDKASESAFALAQFFAEACSEEAEMHGEDQAQATQKKQENATEEDKPAEAPMEWDEVLLPLPAELQKIWTEVAAGTRKLPLSSLLDELPRFEGLPAKPAENNFRQQGKSQQDRLLRSYQQSLLHLLRIMVTAYSAQTVQDSNVRFRMGWQLISELYHRIHNDRKEASIPGSTPVQTSLLFGREDLATMSLAARVNMYKGWRPVQGKSYRFRVTGNVTKFKVKSYNVLSPPGFQFRGFKGKGFRRPFQIGSGRGYPSSSPQGKGVKTTQFRAKAAIHFLSSQAKTAIEVVGSTCPRRSFVKHCLWSGPGLARANIVSFSMLPVPRPDFNCQDLDSRIFGNWSLPKGTFSGDKIFNSLVCAEQEGRGGEKHRLIADCRVLNKFLNPQKFRLDHWKDIYPFLEKGMWGCKIDLQHAYFHMHNHPKLLPYMRINLGEEIFQFNSAVFGLNILPQKFMALMKVPLKTWRQRGLIIFVYLDDILILGKTKGQAKKSVDIVLQTLQEAGLTINPKKSTPCPTQILEHLGFTINFGDGTILVPQEKLKKIRKEMGKIITHQKLSPRKVAAILGSVRSFLTAMPFLRAFMTHTLNFVNQFSPQGWDKQQLVPPLLKEEVQKLKVLMHTWLGRKMGDKCIIKDLHSDSSTFAWGGLRPDWGHYPGFLERKFHSPYKFKGVGRSSPHHKKFFQAGGQGQHPCGQHSCLFIFAQGGGGRKEGLNQIMQDLWTWCMEHKIQVHTTLTTSEKAIADQVSRPKMDHGDYSLDDKVFQQIMEEFSPWTGKEEIIWDTFASPGNRKTKFFISRFPHWEAGLVNALHCSLDQVNFCYSNPPWNLITRWLLRLKKNPHIKCLMVTPWWVSTVWWPLLVKLRVPKSPVLVIRPRSGLFTNCMGQQMAPTRWPLICTLLSGDCWNSKKFRLKPSKTI